MARFVAVYFKNIFMRTRRKKIHFTKKKKKNLKIGVFNVGRNVFSCQYIQHTGVCHAKTSVASRYRMMSV